MVARLWVLEREGQMPGERATIKALPAPLHRPRPYGSPGLLPISQTEVDTYRTGLAPALAQTGESPKNDSTIRLFFCGNF